MTLEQLKSVNVAKYQVEELMQIRGELRMMYQEYEFQKLNQPPEWLNNSINDVDREISVRVRDDRLRRLSELKAKDASYRSNEEKRADGRKEMAELEDLLKQ